MKPAQHGRKVKIDFEHTDSVARQHSPLEEKCHNFAASAWFRAEAAVCKAKITCRYSVWTCYEVRTDDFGHYKAEGRLEGRQTAGHQLHLANVDAVPAHDRIADHDCNSDLDQATGTQSAQRDDHIPSFGCSNSRSDHRSSLQRGALRCYRSVKVTLAAAALQRDECCVGKR